MPTEVDAIVLRWRAYLHVLLCAACVVTPRPGCADIVRVGAGTEVRALDFKGVHSLPEKELRSLLQTRKRVTAFRLRAILGKLPLVPAPPRHVFHPRILQEDVVRLRNKYAASGFVGTQVRYEVERVGDEDLLDIHFVVEEGTPLRVVEATIAPAEGRVALPVPAGEGKSWAGVEKRTRALVGRRLDAVSVMEGRDDMQAWWRDRGHSRAAVSAVADRDSQRAEVRLRFVVAAGPRNRFGAIQIRGNQSISEVVVRRELPFQPGDPYSDAALSRGRRNLQQLQIVRAARIEVPAAARNDSLSAVTDSLLPVLVTVSEAKPRLVSGQFGYVTDAGLSTEASWSHRNFTGGARVFTLSALAQTGLLAIADDPDVRYRGTISLQQPHVLASQLSVVASPFVEYREDLQDRSLEVGSNLTLVYRPHQRLWGSLDYRIATRKIYEYRIEDLLAGNVDLLSFLAQLLEGQQEGSGGYVESSLFTLSATASTLDELTNPRRGVLVRPTVQVTAPTPWSSASYWRADCSAYGFAPVRERTTLGVRFSAGRLFPFGKSLPSEDEPITESVLQLRDASFTAGGSSDVRGWGHRMLGPKFPDIRFVQQGDSLALDASGYVPLGGFSRLTFSFELRLPMPLLGPKFGSHVFLDGGRVWTQDSRFNTGGDRFEQQRFFYATGAGLDLLTPLGAFKLSLGYKLNPSLPDLVDSGDLLRALAQGQPTDQLAKHDSRRWQLHFAIGSSF